MFKRELYTQEDLAIIDKLAGQGRWEDIPKAVIFETPQKAEDMEEYIAENKPVSAPLESVAKEEIQKINMQKQTIETPEEEEALEAKLQAEKKAHAEKLKAKRAAKKHKESK